MSYRSRYFTLLSTFYPFWYRIMQGESEKWVKKECKKIKPTQILEVGVGSGEIFSWLLTQFPLSRIHGIDISNGMLRQTEQRVQSSKHQNFLLTREDITQLQLNSTFDLILSNYVIDTLSHSDILLAMDNLYNSLNQDGILLISTIHSGRRWYEKILPGIAKKLPFLLGYARPINIKKYLEDSGFHVIKEDSSSRFSLSSLHIKAKKV